MNFHIHASPCVLHFAEAGTLLLHIKNNKNNNINTCNGDAEVGDVLQLKKSKKIAN